MNKAEARRLQAFQRETIVYEKIFLRVIRQFIKVKGGDLARLASVSDWDKFHDIIYKLSPQFQKRFNYILREFGSQTLTELK